MIAKLKGIVDTIGEDSLIIDVGGVGYLVFASAKTLGDLPPEGEAVELLTETHVREDHIHLFGFLSTAERDMFRLLLSVQGVGTRVALAIQTVLEPFDLQAALAAGDKGAITQAAGVGPKLAQRIIHELKDKVAIPAGEPVAASAAKGAGPVAGDNFQDALSALVQLGYKPAQAHTALLTAARKTGKEAETSELVKAGLRELSG